MTHREGSMQEPFLVAVPSNAPGGLDAMPSGNLANCGAYTVALVYDCNVLDVVSPIGSVCSITRCPRKNLFLGHPDTLSFLQ